MKKSSVAKSAHRLSLLVETFDSEDAYGNFQFVFDDQETKEFELDSTRKCTQFVPLILLMVRKMRFVGGTGHSKSCELSSPKFLAGSLYGPCRKDRPAQWVCDVFSCEKSELSSYIRAAGGYEEPRVWFSEMVDCEILETGGDGSAPMTDTLLADFRVWLFSKVQHQQVIFDVEVLRRGFAPVIWTLRDEGAVDGLSHDDFFRVFFRSNFRSFPLLALLSNGSVYPLFPNIDDKLIGGKGETRVVPRRVELGKSHTLVHIPDRGGFPVEVRNGYEMVVLLLADSKLGPETISDFRSANERLIQGIDGLSFQEISQVKFFRKILKKDIRVGAYFGGGDELDTQIEAAGYQGIEVQVILIPNVTKCS